ncbi:MAG: leucine-rich repeat domain-containing protein [Haliscomenobacter sp.]|nr:leucine-rich repeat domain-containing protein [Haliscomenobacter sp.]
MSTIQQTLSRVFGVSFTQLPDLTELRQYRHPNAFCCDARGELLGVFSSENACTALRIPAGWQHLEYLNVSDNKGLQSLAFEAPLPRLQHLDASGCQLEVLRIPAGFRALKNLYLQKNRLKTLNLEEGSPNLQLLDASGNELETLHLPEGFSSLAYLFLMDNALETFTFEGALPSLTILHLRNNRLQNVPAALVLSGALEAFTLRATPQKHTQTVFGRPGFI